ncbi:CBL-interacting serine/threonine-protein kinase 21-like isoform X2 [Senna tora]|uniref:CBL-interacting serine/threonine-protein kinase 21-like isoform X2 n=1 Tax=Senna tora TaxID=362788 RepID=A0A834WBB5_9FABA|nr:CBL-interacting serine/threonine-protein kinase 21-like isoform X2 [Senna tora]
MGFASSIGKYQLGRTIGEGNFAKVKLAVNEHNGQYVAIKIIDKKMNEKNAVSELEEAQNKSNFQNLFEIPKSQCHFLQFPADHPKVDKNKNTLENRSGIEKARSERERKLDGLWRWKTAKCGGHATQQRQRIRPRFSFPSPARCIVVDNGDSSLPLVEATVC